MVAKDLMRREVFTIREDQPVEQLTEMIVREHIHGVPVVNGSDELVGIVTQQDAFFGSVTLGREDPAAAETKTKTKTKKKDAAEMLKVRDIMTSPPVFASEDTDIVSLCRMMTRLRIHRVPVVRENKVTGIISSLDICAALVRGRLRPS